MTARQRSILSEKGIKEASPRAVGGIGDVWAPMFNLGDCWPTVFLFVIYQATLVLFQTQEPGPPCLKRSNFIKLTQRIAQRSYLGSDFLDRCLPCEHVHPAPEVGKLLLTGWQQVAGGMRHADMS